MYCALPEMLTALLWQSWEPFSFVVGCLLSVPATWWYISGAGLLRQLYVLPH